MVSEQVHNAMKVLVGQSVWGWTEEKIWETWSDGGVFRPERGLWWHGRR